MTENVPGADLPVQALVVRSIGVFNELVGTIPKPPPKEYLVAHGVAQKTADAYRGFMQTGRRTVAAEGALPDVAALRPLSVASPAGSDDERIRFQAEYQKAKTAFSTYKDESHAWARAAADFKAKATLLLRAIAHMSPGDVKTKMQQAAKDFSLAADVCVRQTTDVLTDMAAGSTRWEAVMQWHDDWQKRGLLDRRPSQGAATAGRVVHT